MKGGSGAQATEGPAVPGPAVTRHLPWEQWEPQKGFSWQEVWETWFRKIALDAGGRRD